MGKVSYLRFCFFIILAASLQVLLFEIYGRFEKPKNGFRYTRNEEWFDSTLMRLNNLDRMEAFCDSVYGQSTIAIMDSSRYADIVGYVLRLRFYHGYSYYRLGQNFIGWALAPFINNDLSAIVIPDDILKHPNAACSQQSIIGMELLKRKGFAVRKVGFYDSIARAGHFCFEAYFGSKWHFFDPDKEPSLRLLEKYGRPSIEELTSNKKLLDSIYYREDSTVRNGYLLKYSYGKVNSFPAPRAIIYQYTTKFLSWSLFFWILLTGYWAWKRRRRRAK